MTPPVAAKARCGSSRLTAAAPCGPDTNLPARRRASTELSGPEAGTQGGDLRSDVVWQVASGLQQPECGARLGGASQQLEDQYPVQHRHRVVGGGGLGGSAASGGASGAEGKLGRTQPLIGAGAAGGRAVAITTADCMTSALAERNTEVAPARQQ